MTPLHIGFLSPPPPSPPPPRSSRPSNAFPWLKHMPVSSSATKLLLQRRRGICRAVELPQDAPFAISIGACMFTSLLFTNPSVDGDGDEEAAISSTDARMAVMTIISFIPYFNWLSWVFALMDTGERRYAVYALVYLAPYLRTNLSLSPDESWLPIASILLCILHIQLEASVRSGDLDASSFFRQVAVRLGLVNVKKDHQPRSFGKKHDKRGHHDLNLPSGKHQSRNEIKNWTLPTKDLEHLNEDGDLDDRDKH